MGARGWAIGLVVVVAAVVGCACDGRGRAPEAARSPIDARPPGQLEGLVERASGDEWLLEATHDATARIGHPTTVVFRGTGREPWHVNVEYPAKLEVVEAEGFTVPAQVLRAAEAAQRFDESELRYEVALTPTTPGVFPVAFRFKFGLCSGDRCVIREAVLRWTYAVGEG